MAGRRGRRPLQDVRRFPHLENRAAVFLFRNFPQGAGQIHRAAVENPVETVQKSVFSTFSSASLGVENFSCSAQDYFPPEFPFPFLQQELPLLQFRSIYGILKAF